MARLNAAALPPARRWQLCLTKFVELCATKCGATSATRAGQSRSRPSTKSQVAGARRRRTRRFRRRDEYWPAQTERSEDTIEVGDQMSPSGSKCEKLNVSKSSPLYPTIQTSTRRADTSQKGPGCVKTRRRSAAVEQTIRHGSVRCAKIHERLRFGSI